jgi:hypothetical protein
MAPGNDPVSEALPGEKEGRLARYSQVVLAHGHTRQHTIFRVPARFAYGVFAAIRLDAAREVRRRGPASPSCSPSQCPLYFASTTTVRSSDARMTSETSGSMACRPSTRRSVEVAAATSLFVDR